MGLGWVVVAFTFLDGFANGLVRVLLSYLTPLPAQELAAQTNRVLLGEAALFVLTQPLFFLVASRVVRNWDERSVSIFRVTFVYAWLGATIHLGSWLTALLVAPALTVVEYQRQLAQSMLANLVEFFWPIPLSFAMDAFRYFLLLLAAFALALPKKWQSKGGI